MKWMFQKLSLNFLGILLHSKKMGFDDNENWIEYYLEFGYGKSPNLKADTVVDDADLVVLSGVAVRYRHVDSQLRVAEQRLL